jgi:hypothetical protein
VGVGKAKAFILKRTYPYFKYEVNKMVNPKETTQISLTLNKEILEKVNVAAKVHGVSVQELLRVWIGEKAKCLEV